MESKRGKFVNLVLHIGLLVYKEAQSKLWSLFLLRVLPAKCNVLRVGLPGLEPGTSSLSEKHNTLQEVSRVCKIPANKDILLLTLFPSFPIIYPGCCTVAAHGALDIT